MALRFLNRFGCGIIRIPCAIKLPICNPMFNIQVRNISKETNAIDATSKMEGFLGRWTRKNAQKNRPTSTDVGNYCTEGPCKQSK